VAAVVVVLVGVGVDVVAGAAGEVFTAGDVVVDFGPQASNKSKHTNRTARALKLASGNNFNFIIKASLTK
jgi:hypothetical protein